MRGGYRRLLLIAVAAVIALMVGAGVGWANDPTPDMADFRVYYRVDPVYVHVPGKSDTQVARFVWEVRQTPSEIQTATDRTLVGLGVDSCTRLHNRKPGADVAAELAAEYGIAEDPARTVVYRAGEWLCPEEFQ